MVPLILGMFFLVIGIIYFSVMFPFTSSVFGGLENPFMYSLYMPLIMFTCIGVIVILIGIVIFATSPNKMADLEAKKVEFLNSVASAPSVKVRTQPLKREYCPHCGSKINPDEKICEQCGGEL